MQNKTLILIRLENNITKLRNKIRSDESSYNRGSNSEPLLYEEIQRHLISERKQLAKMEDLYQKMTESHV